MQAAATALPEFDGLGVHAVAAPVGRRGDFGTGVFFIQRLHGVLKHGAAVDDGTLLRDPRAKLAGARTGVEVGVAFFAGEAGDRALDDDLALQRDPRKQQGNTGVFGEIAALAALVVGVKNEAASVEALEQNRARGRTALSRRGGERHGVGLGDLGGLGLLKPFFKLAEGVARQILFEESGQAVFFAKICEGHEVWRQRVPPRADCQKSSRKHAYIRRPSRKLRREGRAVAEGEFPLVPSRRHRAPQQRPRAAEGEPRALPGVAWHD